jgi:hypothetical protein
MALLYWTSWLLTETSWYETYYRSAVVPVPHQILEEIAYRHPLQRPFVFQVLQNNLTVEVKNLSPEIMVSWEKPNIYMHAPSYSNTYSCVDVIAQDSIGPHDISCSAWLCTSSP